jgi:diguanylate cyclase (GGDEF)-like protein/PAS domain S-box-containing protein
MRQATQIALLYVVVAGMWITFSDRLLISWVESADALTRLQLVIGWAFIAAAGLVLFAVLLHHLRTNTEKVRRYEEQRAEVHALSQFRESIIDNANIWINVLDPQARITVWNKAAEKISGYRREDVLGNTNIWQSLYPDPDYRAAVTAVAGEILDQGTEVEGFETRIQARDGQDKIVAWNSRRFFDEQGQMVGSIAIGRDITARKQMEAALVERERQLATLMANLPGMAYRCLNDRHWTMRFVSGGCLALTGYEPSALLNNSEISYAAIIHPDDEERVWAEVGTAVVANTPFAMEYRIRRKDGEEIWVWEQGRAVNVDGQTFLEGIVIDITKRKRMEQELELMATRDPLTGLYNRRELQQQFGEELARAKRYDHSVSLIWLDVDHFKEINDRFGHHVGDEVLRQLSRLLQSNVRTVDYVARYGGEELVIVLPEMGTAESLDAAERLRRIVGATAMTTYEARPLTITVSIGVVSFPVHGRSPDQLLLAADHAMYQAKQAGRNRVCGAIGHSDHKEQSRNLVQ